MKPVTFVFILILSLVTTSALAQRRDVDCEDMGRWMMGQLAGSAVTHPVLTAKVTRLIAAGGQHQYTLSDVLFMVSKKDAHSAVDIIFGIRDRAAKRFGKEAVLECIGDRY